MAFNNIILCVTALLLTCGPALINAGCEGTTCIQHLTYDSYPCLSCNSTTKDELLKNLRQPQHNNVTGLYTQYMDISAIPLNHPELYNMSCIIIGYNKENVNARYIQNLTNLKYFLVFGSENNNEFEGFYVSTTYDLTIYFHNNKIKTIKSLCLGHYPQRWSLSLSDNQIDSFTRSSVRQSNCSSTLRLLDLSGNKLTSLSADVLLELPSLETFNVRLNKITYFSNNLSSYYDITKNNKSFQPLNLKHFVMSGNQLSTLNDESFKFFNNLEELTLYSNKLKYISPGAFSDLKQLKTLYLSNNLLTYLDPQTFSSLNSLVELKIHNNKFVIFELRNFQLNLNSLKKVSLSRNQWDCGALSELLTYLSNKHVDYGYIEESISKERIRNINCYPSNILPRILQLAYNITRYIYHQDNLSQHELTAEQRLIDINMAELQQLKGDNVNLKGDNCVSYMLGHIIQLENTIDIKQAINTAFNINADVRNLRNETKNKLNKMENLLNETRIGTWNALNDSRLYIIRIQTYIVILSCVLVSLVVLLVCVGVYCGWRGRGGVTHELQEIVDIPRSADIDQPAYLYIEAPRDTDNQQEPEYHYVEAPREAGHQRESCIYEEIDFHGPSSSPDQGGEYVAMSPIATTEDEASSPVYDQLG